jgi:hypothetical protein
MTEMTVHALSMSPAVLETLSAIAAPPSQIARITASAPPPQSPTSWYLPTASAPCRKVSMTANTGPTTGIARSPLQKRLSNNPIPTPAIRLIVERTLGLVSVGIQRSSSLTTFFGALPGYPCSPTSAMKRASDQWVSM